MQGYIIDVKNVRDDDLIVTILSADNLYTTYRFYGARHSIINIGYKIDFELENNFKTTIPRLKEVIQLGFNWILEREKLYCWQRYIKLFYPHLKEVESIDDFYFQLLDETVHKMIKQNPKRAIIESYIKLLDYEGRLHKEYECLLCEQKIEHEISLVRSFLPTHPSCSYSKKFKMTQIEELFGEYSLLNFEDDEVEYIWNILLQGL
ncbi:MAG: recombination protein RecO [Candidatus Marinarcus sp.]|uniref:recombination protein RecO n=1 Tax=Candidatus Marinarcus sp. TaxID=3100987 RepID=UPI003B008D02